MAAVHWRQFLETGSLVVNVRWTR